MKRGATDAVMVSRGDAKSRRVRLEGRGSFRAMRQVSSASWSETTIADALVKVRRPKSIPLSQYLSEGCYPVIDQGKNLVAGYTNDESAVIFSPLPITIFGDHTRIVKFSKIPFATGADGTQLLYPKAGIDPTFFYYAIKNIDLSNYFYARHFKYLKASNIPLPPLPVQRRIADILSAYDDLIENNRRRISILEETARLTYRKWFGGGEGRLLPLAEVADVLYGKDHKKIQDGDIPIFGSGGIMRYGAKAIYEQPSVLIPRKGTISNVMYVEEPFWTVDTMFYTRVKIPNMERILYYQLCDYNIASMSTGAAVPSMTTAILNALRIVVPPSELRQRFDEAVSPIFGQCRILKKQSAALAAARDMLLPRLMKGFNN